jgi:hypothetical protein
MLRDKQEKKKVKSTWGYVCVYQEEGVPEMRAVNGGTVEALLQNVFFSDSQIERQTTFQ